MAVHLPPSDSLRSALIANSSRVSPPKTPWISAVIHSGVLVYDTALLIFVACNAWPLMRARPAGRPAPSNGERVTVAVILTARNEAAVLPVTLEALFEQTDPADRIVIADDGSNDTTADLMRDRYGIVAVELGTLSAPSPMHPSLHWLRLAQEGKAAALNAAIVQIESAVVLTVDADTLLERHAIAAVRQAFAAEPELAGITGVIAPLCRRTVQGRIFEWFQTYEYIRNFLSRYAWMQVESLLLISSAFAGFRRASVVAVGGFDQACLVEDYELIHRMRRHASRHGLTWRFRVLGDALAHTEAPGDIAAFLRQRRRWFGGFLQTQYWYRAMVGDTRLGWLGVAMLPVKAVDTLQPLYGLTAFFLLLYFAATGRYGVLVPASALIGLKIAIDVAFHLWSRHLYRRWIADAKRDSIGWALLAALIEPFSFQLLRHVGAALGWVSFLAGTWDWKVQERFGFDKDDAA